MRMLTALLLALSFGTPLWATDRKGTLVARADSEPRLENSVACALMSEELLSVRQIAPSSDGSAYVLGRWKSKPDQEEIRRVGLEMRVDPGFRYTPPTPGGRVS